MIALPAQLYRRTYKEAQGTQTTTKKKTTKLTMNPARGTWIGKGGKLMTNVPMASKMKRIPINRQKYCPPTLAPLQSPEEKDPVAYPTWQPAPAPIKAVVIISRI